MSKPDFKIENNYLGLFLSHPHTQVLPWFPNYDYRNPVPGTIIDYRDGNNVVGHQQRAFMCYWAIRSFIESDGGIGLDAGGAGVAHPACLSLDLCGNEAHPVYGGQYTGVHVKGDAADLSMFLDNSFSCIISNHILEHLNCIKLKGNETPEEKIKLACSGREIIDVLIYHWLRVLRPSGYLASIIPDNRPSEESGSNVFYQDSSHQHSWRANDFWQTIVSPILKYVEVISFDTLKNNFSFELVCRKK